MSSTNDRDAVDKLIERWKAMGARHISYSRRPAATIAEASDPNVVYGVKSLREVVEELDRRFPEPGTAEK